jgi:hypothetical protein
MARMVWARFLRKHYVPAVLIVMLVTGTWAWIRSTARPSAAVALAPRAVLTVDMSKPGNMFEPGAVGLSLETRELSTDHLSSNHYRLVRLMRLLGPSILRIGGNSVDLSWWTSHDESPPFWATNTVTPADLYILRDLLHTTGWRVLLGVNLGHFEPARAADEALYAREILGTELLGIEIGNEPDDFGGEKANLRPSTYSVSEYLREAEAYRQALNAITPNIAIYGPALGQAQWLPKIGTAAHMFTQFTQHYYPTSACPGAPPTGPQPTAAGLLSPEVRQQENEVLESLVHASIVAGRSTRIGETNGVSCSGSDSASPTLASALWALDWALRAASSGVKGLNFHGGLDFCGSDNPSPICAPRGETASAGDVVAQSEYYGLLAARQMEGGRFVPTRLIAPDPLPNITTWATIARSGVLKIVIDNLNTASLAQPVLISSPGYAYGIEERLIGPYVEARNGVTFGAASVTNTGQWQPRITTHPGRYLRVVVPSASAVLITLHRTRSRGHNLRTR